MTSPLSSHRLFVPLSALPFDWFASGKKQWEVRRNKGAFHTEHLRRGRRVELRYGYTGHSLWGTIAESVRAPDAAHLFDMIPFETTVPIASSKSEAIAFVENLLAKDDELVAFRVELDTELVTQRIAFDPNLLGLVDQGDKTTTVRAGHRDYQAGPVVLNFGSDITRRGAIVRTHLTTLDKLTTRDARNEGYRTTDELMTVLHTYYPDLAPEAPITIVEFRCRPE